MDEAEILSDRVAVMAEGMLLCVGSPFFLKAKYAFGYTLTVCPANACIDAADATGANAATTADAAAESTTTAAGAAAGADATTAVFTLREAWRLLLGARKIVPGISFVDSMDMPSMDTVGDDELPSMDMPNGGTDGHIWTAPELSFDLPSSTRTAFPAVLRWINAQSTVKESGISCPTLEDVFLNLAHQQKSHADDQQQQQQQRDEQYSKGTSRSKSRSRSRSISGVSMRRSGLRLSGPGNGSVLQNYHETVRHRSLSSSSSSSYHEEPNEEIQRSKSERENGRSFADFNSDASFNRFMASGACHSLLQLQPTSDLEKGLLADDDDDDEINCTRKPTLASPVWLGEVQSLSPNPLPQSEPTAASRVASALCCQGGGSQYLALLRKRARCARRDPRSLVCSGLVPIVFVLILAVVPHMDSWCVV
jgi:hypothetical protein